MKYLKKVISTARFRAFVIALEDKAEFGSRFPDPENGWVSERDEAKRMLSTSTLEDLVDTVWWEMATDKEKEARAQMEWADSQFDGSYHEAWVPEEMLEEFEKFEEIRSTSYRRSV